ncbi:Caax prenyl protease, partial [Thalictrum thalictroides]
NLVAPIVAHIFCNIMGLPVMHSKSKGWITIAFVAGQMGFMWFLFPATRPDLYNEKVDDCRCWHGYCSWS